MEKFKTSSYHCLAFIFSARPDSRTLLSSTLASTLIFFTLISGSLTSSKAFANELDLSVSDESFRVNYNIGLKRKDTNADFDYFYNDETEVGIAGLGLFVSGRSNACLLYTSPSPRDS